MRAGPLVLAAAFALTGACTGGDRSSFLPPGTAPSTTSEGRSTSITVAPTTDPVGSVTLRATVITLPDIRSGGSGLRVLVQAASPRLAVRRNGGGGPVTAAPWPAQPPR